MLERTVVYVWLETLPWAPGVRSPRLSSCARAPAEEEEDRERDAEQEREYAEDDREDRPGVVMMCARVLGRWRLGCAGYQPPWGERERRLRLGGGVQCDRGEGRT